MKKEKTLAMPLDTLPPRGKLYTEFHPKRMHLPWEPKIGKYYKVKDICGKWVLAKLINVHDKGDKYHYEGDELIFNHTHLGNVQWIEFAMRAYG